MTRRVILSADDFGMSPGVNAGILRAHGEGVLTDASLMVTGAAFDEAVDMARSTPSLSVGLHLVLVQGRAAAAPRTIPAVAGRDGMFPANPVVAGLRYFFRPGVRRQLEREIAAQLEKFLRTGLELSHVDGHLNIHAHPAVLPILLRLAGRYGIRALRLPREPLPLSLQLDGHDRLRKQVESVIFRGLCGFAAPRLAAGGIVHPDRMFGLHQSGHMTEPYLLGLVKALPGGVTEIYSHPSVLDAEARRWRPPDYESEAELRALTSPRLRAALAAVGAERISYRDLAAGAAVTPRRPAGAGP